MLAWAAAGTGGRPGCLKIDPDSDDVHFPLSFDVNDGYFCSPEHFHHVIHYSSSYDSQD